MNLDKEANTLHEALTRGLDFKCNGKGYLESYTCNIYKGAMDERFQAMFDNGSGSELHSKAKAVHSSSMLSYNFLHWVSADHPLEIDSVKYTKVFFEVQMKTLTCSNRPANMDVVLAGEHEGRRHYLFIESKFSEYLESKKFMLSRSYTDERKWFNHNVDWKSIIASAGDICNDNCYADGIKQGITHLFGIEGLSNQTALNWFCEKNPELAFSAEERPVIRFANFIFSPSKDYASECAKYNEYKKLYARFIEHLKQCGSVVPEWYSYSDLWKIVKPQIEDPGLVDYLENRYMKYAAL